MRRKLIIIIAGIILILLSMVIYRPVENWPYLSSQLNKYSGDGVIKDESIRFLVLPVKGYSISFPIFNLGTNQNKSYRLSELPTIGKKVGIYFVIEDPIYYWRDENIKTLEGGIEIILRDSKGVQLIKINSKLKDLIWSSHYAKVNGHALYNLDKSFFNSDRSQNYVLDFRYIADMKLKQTNGNVYIRCGGSL
jgi:hypothetical protein